MKQEKRLAFQSHYGVTPYKNGHYNLVRLLKTGGAPLDAVRAVADRIGPYSGGARSGPFDHGEMWGRQGKPVILVGHPYGLRKEDRELLEAIASLGLVVKTDGESYYSAATVQVLVLAGEQNA